MFLALHKRLHEREEGFTLIELLVVVIIIGILAAIAIPTFLNQRQNGWARAAQSDLRNGAIVMEESFNTAGAYPVVASATNAAPGIFNISPDVTVASSLTTTGGVGDGFCLTANHASLGAANSVDFRYDSREGTVETGTTCTST